MNDENTPKEKEAKRMLACYSHHRQRTKAVTVNCAPRLTGSPQRRTVRNRAALQKARRQEQLALYTEARLKKVPSAKRERYLFTDRCHLS